MASLGYLVPEFPNQTHAFFWREVQAMRAMGVKVLFLSTRRPPDDACPHDFAEAARAETRYLFPPPMGATARFLARRPLRTAAALRYVAGLTESSAVNRAKVAAMLPSAAELCLQARAFGVTHVHVQSCANTAHLAALANILGDLPYSLALHGDLEVYGTDHRSKFARAVMVRTSSRQLIDQVRSIDPGKPCQDISMGVEIDRFRPATEPAARAVPQFVTVARLNPTKGHVFFLRAMRQVLDEGLQLGYTIIGDGTEKAAIMAEIDRLGLGSTVTMRPSMSQGDVLDVLHGSDGFVLTSFGEGEAAPVAVMEAMSAGVPAICSDIGGTSDMITDGVDGLLVAQRDEASIATALRRLVTDGDLRARLGRGARLRAERQFDCAVKARELLRAVGLQA
jgi:colanic acid/amylovoran biosynthesis glycosyltransferase